MKCKECGYKLTGFDKLGITTSGTESHIGRKEFRCPKCKKVNIIKYLKNKDYLLLNKKRD